MGNILARFLGEALVGIDRYVLRMIEDHQSQMIEVEYFVHRFRDLEDVLAVARDQLIGLDFDRLFGPRRARPSVGAEFTHRAGAEEVGDVGEAITVPGEKNRTGGAFAVSFLNALRIARQHVQFRLDHAIGPVQAQHIGLVGGADAERQRQPRLAQAGRQGGILHAGPKRTGLGNRPNANAVGVGTKGVCAFGIASGPLAQAGQFQVQAVVAVAHAFPHLQAGRLRPNEQIEMTWHCQWCNGHRDNVSGPALVGAERMGRVD